MTLTETYIVSRDMTRFTRRPQIKRIFLINHITTPLNWEKKLTLSS